MTAPPRTANELFRLYVLVRLWIAGRVAEDLNRRQEAEGHLAQVQQETGWSVAEAEAFHRAGWPHHRQAAACCQCGGSLL